MWPLRNIVRRQLRLCFVSAALVCSLIQVSNSHSAGAQTTNFPTKAKTKDRRLIADFGRATWASCWRWMRARYR